MRTSMGSECGASGVDYDPVICEVLLTGGRMRSPRVASATVFLLSVSLLTGCATVNRWWSWLFPTSKEPITSTTAPGAPQTPMPSAVVIATPDTAVNAVNQADSAGKPAGSNFDSATDPAPAATQSSSFVDVADQ